MEARAQLHVPAAFLHETTPANIEQKAGWAPRNRLGTLEKRKIS